MACCGANPQPAGPLLSGVLSDQYGDTSSPANPPAVQVQGVAGTAFSSGLFWLIVVVIGVAAFMSDREQRRNE